MNKLTQAIEDKARLLQQHEAELASLRKELSTTPRTAPDATPVFRWPNGWIAQLCVVFLFFTYAAWAIFDWVTSASYVLADTQSWLASLGYSSLFAMAPLALKVVLNRSPKGLKPWLIGLVAIIGVAGFAGVTWCFASNYANQSNGVASDPLALIASKDLRFQFSCQVIVGAAVGVALLTALAHLLIVPSDSRLNADYELLNNRAMEVLCLMAKADESRGDLRGQLAAYEASREFHARDWLTLVQCIRLYRKFHEDMLGIDGTEET
jgi:hypothetical protein